MLFIGTVSKQKIQGKDNKNAETWQNTPTPPHQVKPKTKGGS